MNVPVNIVQQAMQLRAMDYKTEEIKAEDTAYKVCFYLDGIEDIYLTPEGSEARVSLLIDLFLDLGEGGCVGVQIVPSQHDADRHLQRGRVVYGHRAFPVPPVVVSDHPLKMLWSLSEVANLTIKSSAADAIDIAYQWAELWGDQLCLIKAVNSRYLRIWRELEMVRVKGNDFLFTLPPK